MTRYQYKADYPERDRPPGVTLKWRSSKKVAMLDMAAALSRHMGAAEGHSPGNRRMWVDWSFRFGAGLTRMEAPDGTLWQILRRVKPLDD